VLFSHLALSVLVESSLTPEQVEATNTCNDGAGLSEVVQGASTPRRMSVVSQCTSADIALWQNISQDENDQDDAICGTSCGLAVMAGPECYSECKVDSVGYTQPCAVCFAEKARCSATNCFLDCLPPNQLSAACLDCGSSFCGAAFAQCHGMGFHNGTGIAAGPRLNGTSADVAETRTTTNTPSPQGQDSVTISMYYSVGKDGELGFLDSVDRAWGGNAKFLAIFLVVASGINPYLENLLLGVAMFAPLTRDARRRLLWFVNRFGRWTFVDVFVVVAMVCGLDFWAMNNMVHVRARSRIGIFMFALATIWARVQGACVEAMQDWSDPAPEPTSDEKGALLERHVKKLQIGACFALVVLVIGLVAPSISYETEDGVTGAITLRHFSVLELGVQQGASGEGAGVLGLIFMGATYYIFAVALPIAHCLAVAVAPSVRPRALWLVDRVCSASSLDVLAVSILIFVSYYGDIIAATSRCWVRPGDPEVIVARGGVLWGYGFLVVYALASLVLTEAVTMLHDRLPAGTRTIAKPASSQQVVGKPSDDVEGANRG